MYRCGSARVCGQVLTVPAALIVFPHHAEAFFLIAMVPRHAPMWNAHSKSSFLQEESLVLLIWPLQACFAAAQLYCCCARPCCTAAAAAATSRSDVIHPAGPLICRDLVSILPMLDETVVLQATGQQLLEALENGVSTYPKLEGRFPQVS